MPSKFDLDWSLFHDKFNLVVLPILISCNIFYLVCRANEILALFTTLFSLYLLVDFFWIFFLPQSVASPLVILFHHLVSLVGVISIPFMSPEIVEIVLIGTLVEINTFIRVVRKSFRDSKVVDLLFYISWFAIRCLIGPWLLVKMIVKASSEQGFLNWILLIVAFTLNALNAKWTFELLFKVNRDTRGL